MLPEGEEESHCHRDCVEATANHCSIEAYQQWRLLLQLGLRHQCFRCGLSQAICTAVEDQAACRYPHLMLPGLFFLAQVGQLYQICQLVGFAGEPEQLWQWMNRLGDCDEPRH